MEHMLDIEVEIFDKIKEHEITVITIPKQIHDREVKIHDSLKLYPSGGDTEAVRIEITALSESSQEEQQEKNAFIEVHFELLEWMCWIETELDEQLREEKEWLEGMR